MDLFRQTKNNSLVKLELRMTRSGLDHKALVPEERDTLWSVASESEGKRNQLDRGRRHPLPTAHTRSSTD